MAEIYTATNETGQTWCLNKRELSAITGQNKQTKTKGRLNMENFLTVKEVATLLRMTPDTIKRFIRTGRIEAVKIGRNYRVTKSAVEKAMKAYSIAIKTPGKKAK